MELVFEKSVSGRGQKLLPDCDVSEVALPASLCRAKKAQLPELSENDISRHYTALSRRTFGVNNGFYPLGSCTMKYNPKVDEMAASLPGFADIHPTQCKHTTQGALTALKLAEDYLCEITGMNRMTMQPAAGAHGEFTGLLLIKKYHEARGDTKRNKIIVPDSAHGTNPASAAMVGMKVVNIPSDEKGCVDLEALKAAVGEDTAGLMLTNPNTVGIFDRNILKITSIVHEAGGLCYYDGANLNAIMGVCRPGDMGFDCIHLNLHKTFATPHGGGGPGAGPVGCKEFLSAYLPKPTVEMGADGLYYLDENRPQSIGRVKSFYGNFLVVIKALTYVLTLGKEGIPEASQNAVLNANYLMHQLSGAYQMAYEAPCMHEFVMTLEQTKKDCGVSAMDVAKSLLDHGMHPPTMYFPLIVHEALMVEPTETESKEVLDQAATEYLAVLCEAKENPEAAARAPAKAVIGRPDEVAAARNPILRYVKD